MKRYTGQNKSGKSSSSGSLFSGSSSMVNAFKEAESIAEKIAGIFDAGAETMVASFASAFGYVQQMVSLIQAIQNTASILDTIFSFIPGGSVIGGILGGGGRASGGPVTGSTPYVVGENGPELFIPDMDGVIAPLNSASPFFSSFKEDILRDNNLNGTAISPTSSPEITVIVQSEVERSKAIKFFTNHFPEFENRRGKEILS